MPTAAVLRNLETGEEYRLPFNPDELDEVNQAVWQQLEAPGQTVAGQVWVRGEPLELSVAFLVDGYDTDEDARELTDVLRRWWEPGAQGQAPPELLFVYASVRLPCVLVRLRRRWTLFHPDGRPARAEVELTLRQSDAIERARQGQPQASSAQQTRMHTVRQGDTLWGLAYQYLGNEARWREIWEANPQVTHPRRLQPGMILTIPPA